MQGTAISKIYRFSVMRYRQSGMLKILPKKALSLSIFGFMTDGMTSIVEMAKKFEKRA